jgi:hypothetical protein
MSTLKMILLFLAVGTASLIVAGCYGVQHPYPLEAEDELTPPASEPVEGLETQPAAAPDTKP